MEIAPVPHRSSHREWRRLVLGLLVLTPVVLLVLLPAVLDLDRLVITDDSMDGDLARGSVVLARQVAPSDLQRGDVISFQPREDRGAAPGEARVTRRIESIDGGVATTRGDTAAAADPWRLELTDKTYARVWVSVPWVGYPFVHGGGWVVFVLAAVGALALGAPPWRRRAPRRRVAPAPGAPDRLPVG